MVEDGDIIYHYCSVESLLGIIDTGTIWLTNIQDTNDKTEFSLLHDKAIDLIKDSIKGENDSDYFIALTETVDRILKFSSYICCFSTMPDQLSQWRGYGVSGHGVAIGFSRKKLKLIEQSPIPSITLNNCLGIQDVIYLDDESCIDVAVFTKHFKGLLSDYSSNHDKGALIMALSNFLILLNQHSLSTKHLAFTEEKEVRIIYSHHETTDNEIKQARTHNKHDLPHGRRIIRNKIRKYYIYKYPSEALINITRGCNCNLSTEDIRLILSEKSSIYRSIDIRDSICPFRD